jgi:ATP-dependent Clp protease protease subunit
MHFNKESVNMRKNNLNPIFFEKTKDGEVMYDVSSRLIKDRVIFLDCAIDMEIASQIVSLLFLLDREESDEPIQLWISSPGGCVEGFFAIYDMMQRIETPIMTICMGEACSAAALLLASGSVGMRYSMPNARIMIHQIQVDGLGGSNAEIKINVKELEKLQAKLTDVLALHTGKSKKKVNKDTTMDRYLSAEEALKYGIIDEIMKPKKKLPEFVG